MGTAELACASLKALAASSQFQVVAVVTQPDRPKGRDLKLQPPAVKQTALAAGLPVLQPERARDPVFVEELRRLDAALIVVAAYGQLLPSSILALPTHGCVNVHTSLLPKYRGAAPIQWAILNDEPETGVTIMQMVEKLDAGAILSQRATPIAQEDNAATLHDRLAHIGAELLLETLPQCVNNTINPRPQDEAAASYARKITKEDGRLDWSQPARSLWNRIRAFTPWPGAYITVGRGELLRAPNPLSSGPPNPRMLKIWKATVLDNLSGRPGEVLEAGGNSIVVACGEAALRIHELQMEGGRRLTVGQFLAGHRWQAGDRLG